jgi:hypothetical protein
LVCRYFRSRTRRAESSSDTRELAGRNRPRPSSSDELPRHRHRSVSRRPRVAGACSRTRTDPRADLRWRTPAHRPTAVPAA